jgi:uncharacterized protein YkwD
MLAFLVAPSTGGASPAAARSKADLWSIQSGLLDGINAIRTGHGLAPLVVSSQLDSAAAQHSSDMLANGYFSHISFGGGSFADRLLHFFPNRGCSLWSAGENLMWSSGDVTPDVAISLWMASPPHRANILSPLWHVIGISADAADPAPGTFLSGPATVVTVDFGVCRHR